MREISKEYIKRKVKDWYNLAATHPRITYAIFLVVVFSLILLNTEY